MIENHQCDSSCEIHYGGSKGSMYHGKHHDDCSDAYEYRMSHGHSCGCGSADPMEQAKKLLESAIFYSIERSSCRKN